MTWLDSRINRAMSSNDNQSKPDTLIRESIGEMYDQPT
jgi:hypothetical protein